MHGSFYSQFNLEMLILRIQFCAFLQVICVVQRSTLRECAVSCNRPSECLRQTHAWRAFVISWKTSLTRVVIFSRSASFNLLPYFCMNLSGCHRLAIFLNASGWFWLLKASARISSADGNGTSTSRTCFTPAFSNFSHLFS